MFSSFDSEDAALRVGFLAAEFARSDRKFDKSLLGVEITQAELARTSKALHLPIKPSRLSRALDCLRTTRSMN